MSIATRLLTYEDLCETPDDFNRYEIIGGELIVTPAPVPRHQRVLARLFFRFSTFVNARDLGEIIPAPCDVKLDKHDIVEPDLIFIARERLHIIGDKYIDGAPDLLVEVLSPSTRRRDRTRKAELYATAGVREYWLADPETRTLAVFTLIDSRFERVAPEGSIVRSLVLPGLEVDIEALFAGL